MKILVSPVQKIILSFIILIFIGTVLLLLPISTNRQISVVDAMFTSTSAVCVTGLTVQDIATTFTFFGKTVILLLFQLGGFGIMTFSIGLLSFFGGNFSIRWRYTFRGMYSEIDKIPIRSILVRVVKYTFVIEAVSAVVLFSQFVKDFSVLKAAEHSIFHSVSAFCNAGFSSFSSSLVGYQGNSIVILTTAVTIILGGLGFIVLNEIVNWRPSRIRLIFKGLSFHTKIVLMTSFFLIVFGFIVFFLLERNYVLSKYSIHDSILISFFQSVTCRTAGFNSIDLIELRQSTHFLMILLMFIGGSPGSIAGGIKTTTVAIIVMLIISKLKGEDKISFWGRSIKNEVVERSTTLLILSVTFVLITTFFLLSYNGFGLSNSFMAVLFESVSAFGTAGLSLGLTGKLLFADKIVVSFVMLVGRLGPLTLIMAIISNKKKGQIEYPEEHIMIG